MCAVLSLVWLGLLTVDCFAKLTFKEMGYTRLSERDEGDYKSSLLLDPRNDRAY